MRLLLCGVLTLCVLAGAARADYSKAWTAAKANLPATTRVVAVLDVAALVKTPQFPQVLAGARKAEKELDVAYRFFEKRCKVDPTTAVEGVVVAGDPKTAIVVFAQLALDREKASACLGSMLKVMDPKKKTTIRQDGMFTVATIEGTAGTETAYFGWVAPNVVAFVLDADKQKLEAWLGKKGFDKAPVAPLFAKTNRKAVLAGAFVLEKPLRGGATSGFGHAIMTGGNLALAVVGTTPDAATATTGAGELTKDKLEHGARERTPPAVKTLLSKIAIAAKGTQITISGTVGANEVAEVVLAELAPKKAPPPPPPPRSP